MTEGQERRIDWVFGGVLSCFALSGFAALLYQTVWLRQFSIVFGTAELAVATVLASYMAGLAAGSALAGRFVSRIRRPVLVYGVLEMAIAIGALAIPGALNLIRWVQISWFGGQAEPPHAGGITNSLFYLLCAFTFLAVPTGCMGATLPMLTRHAVRRREQIGSRVGVLYAINTGGAVAGTLTAAFVFLPALGLWMTLVIGAAVNVLVFGIAAAISRTVERVPHLAKSSAIAGEGLAKGEPKTTQSTTDQANGPIGWLAPQWVLPIMLLSGAVSFTYEVLWTRLLSHVLGSSIFAFATMLATFLCGITVGSAVAARFARDRDRSAFGLAIAQFGTAGLSLATYLLLDQFSGMVVTPGHYSMAADVFFAWVVILPSTLCIGATYPFAVRILARDEKDAAQASARVYAWNTVGAIVGAVLAGFFLMPIMKFEGVVGLAAAVNMVLSFGAGLLRTAGYRKLLIAGCMTGSAVLLLFQPVWPERILRTSPLPDPLTLSRESVGEEIVFYSVGRSSTVVMLEDNQGRFNLRTNGLPEAWISPRGGWPESSTLLAALPLLARREAGDVLMIGFGGGVVLSGVPPSVAAIDVIELEPEVIAANERIRDRRHRDPLSDYRLNLIYNDARSALALTSKRYDVIISQPSHPWTSGASHLYTSQFMSMVRNHLKPGGLFVQWINALFVDELLLKSLGATVLATFPQVELYEATASEMYFLASDKPIELVPAFAQRSRFSRAELEFYLELGLGSVGDLAAMLRLDHEGLVAFCGNVPISTDDDNLMATRSPRAVRNPLRMSIVEKLMQAYDPLVHRRDWLERSVGGRIDWFYVVRRLYNMRFNERAQRVMRSIERESEWRAANAWLSPPSERRKLYRQALEADPDNDDLRFALLLESKDQILRGTDNQQWEEDAQRLRGVEAAVIQGWRLASRKQWSDVRALEDQLAQAQPHDVCYGSSVLLRVQWRVSEDTPGHLRSQLAAEAIAILDLGWAIDPELQVSGIELRLEAGLAAGRADVVVETASWAVNSIQQDPSAKAPENREATRRLLSGMYECVQQFGVDQGVSHRAKKVARLLDQALGELL